MQLEIVMIPVNKIIPYWRNPRRNDKTVDALVEVIPKRGFDVPIVVDKNYVVVKGHARLRAAKRLGMTEVPCIISQASDDVIKADRIADNKIQEMSTWQFGKLDAELERYGDKMEFVKLFKPEKLEESGDGALPEIPQFTPAGLDFGGDFAEAQDEIPTARYEQQEEQHHDVPIYVDLGTPAKVEQGAEAQTPQKKQLKTLCPYCGKVVVIDV